MTVAWLPVAGLFRLLARGGSASQPVDATLSSGILNVIPQLGDPVLMQVLLDSAVFALEVAAGVMLIAWVAGLYARPGSAETWRRWLRPVHELAPLVLGVGLLAVPWLAALASRFLLDRGQDRTAVLLGDLGAAIDPRGQPWILAACGVGLVLLPRFFRSGARELAAAFRADRQDSCHDAAILSGASRCARGRSASQRVWAERRAGSLFCS